MPKVSINLDQLRNKIIDQLARNNSSLVYRKQLANEFNVGVDFINNIYSHSKAQINEIRAKIYEEERGKNMVVTTTPTTETGVGYIMLTSDYNKSNTEVSKPAVDIISTKENSNYVPRTLEDMKMGRKLTEGQKTHLIEEIENSSELTTLGEKDCRFIDPYILKKIADRNFVTIITAERYTKDYTIVKIDKDHRFCKTPQSIDKRRIPQELVDIMDDLLRTTTLYQYEIAEIIGRDQSTVSLYKTNNSIERPKEDEDVKEKTNKKRKELRRKRNEKESKERRAAEAAAANKVETENKTEEIVAVEEKVEEAIVAEATNTEPEVVDTPTSETEAVVEEPNKLIYSCKCGKLRDEKLKGIRCKFCHTICELVPEDEKKVTIVDIPDSEESVTEDLGNTGFVNNNNRKQGASITELLNNRSIHRISIDNVVECVLVDGRHGTPPRPALFETELSPELRFNFPDQDKVCENFIKKHIKFNDKGEADKIIKVYCTGLQSPLIALTRACLKYKVNFNAYHYNSDTHKYVEQPGIDIFPCYNNIGVGITAITKTFGNNLYRYKCTVRDIENNNYPLYVIECKYSIYDKCDSKSTAIICCDTGDYKELFMSIVSCLIDNKIVGVKAYVHHFNYNTDGIVVKNNIVNRFFV